MSLILDEHRQYPADGNRVSAFRHAIEEVVTPGDVVLDLGSGTGILGLMACRAGAKRVYAVDEGPIVGLAREVAKANGFQDRITHIKGLSTRVALPEKVDIVLADQVGRFGLESGRRGPVPCTGRAAGSRRSSHPASHSPTRRSRRGRSSGCRSSSRSVGPLPWKSATRST